MLLEVILIVPQFRNLDLFHVPIINYRTYSPFCSNKETANLSLSLFVQFVMKTSASPAGSLSNLINLSKRWTIGVGYLKFILDLSVVITCKVCMSSRGKRASVWIFLGGSMYRVSVSKHASVVPREERQRWEWIHPEEMDVSWERKWKDEDRKGRGLFRNLTTATA